MAWKNVKNSKMIIFCSAVVIMLLISLIVFLALTRGPSEFRLAEHESYITAEPNEGGIPKSDSDFRWIDNEKVAWPDKLSDIEETYIYGTNKTNPDTDGDGMEDGWEAMYGVRNPITGRLTIDPNKADALENPDGDGYDEYPVWTEYMNGIPLEHRGNGILDGGDNLTNIEEYVGGAFTGIFQWLDPVGDAQEIAMKGGFHLAWTLEHTEYPGEEEAYDIYKDFYPSKSPMVTTNPSNWDTDGDGMDDGYELHFRDAIASLREETVYFAEEGSENYVVGEYDYDIDPLDPADGEQDFDVRMMDVNDANEGAEIVFYKDGLTCKEEYIYNTDPTKWDTDGDSYYDPVRNEFKEMDDWTEVNTFYDRIVTLPSGEKVFIPDSNVDWNNDGIIDNWTNPNDPDTDGDLMPDGWELTFGLKPLNSSDRFLDLDQDGLQNYQEYSYPTYSTRWFTTDPFHPDTDGDGMPDGWEAENAQLIVSNEVPPEEDTDDGIADGISRIFTVNPMVKDDAADNDGLWFLDEATGQYIYTHTPDNLTNIEEWKPGHWLDDIPYGTWVPTGLYQSGTNPNDPDTDGDGLTDGQELKVGFNGELIGDIYFTNSAISGTYYTNASNPDSDSDADPTNSSMTLDDWEETHGINREVMPDNGWDDDGDGLIDEVEGEQLIFSPTNATNPDSDLEGLNDVDELFGIWTGVEIPGDPTSGFGWVRTDPNHKDTDLDHINDWLELQVMVNTEGSYKPYKTNPLDSDTDDDGMEDGLEWITDFYPWMDWNEKDNWDRNEDGDLLDGGDIFSTVDRTSPRLADTDSDGLPDGWEYKWGATSDLALIKGYDDLYGTDLANVWEEGMTIWLINPLDPNDVFQDPDRDRLTNWEEFENGTDPLNWDTDGDGMADYWEIEMAQWAYDEDSRRWGFNLDPLDPTDWWEDPDHDGVEYALWTETEPDQWKYITYYFPWCNLYEYWSGFNLDGDAVNEVTTDPNEKDPDSDGMPDGFEFWYSDIPSSDFPWSVREDGDTLPAGWELFFNGTLWNKPEVYPYEYNVATGEKGQVYGPPGGWKAGTGENYEGQFNPRTSDSDTDSLGDWDEDPDGDGYTNFKEYLAHTDPTDTNSNPTVIG